MNLDNKCSKSAAASDKTWSFSTLEPTSKHNCHWGINRSSINLRMRLYEFIRINHQCDKNEIVLVLGVILDTAREYYERCKSMGGFSYPDEWTDKQHCL